MKRLFLILVVALALVQGCGSDSSTDPTLMGNSLVFTRADETPLTYEGPVVAWCGMWEEGVVPVPSIIIQQSGGSHVGYWQARAVLADVAPGHSISFPNTFVWNQPSGADLFIFDAGRGNELSSQTEESSGWIRFTRAGCGEGEWVDFSIDAVIESEFVDMGAIRVRGSLRAQLTGGPGR